MIPTPVYYETQCYKDYFYGEDGLWETRLSNMEGKWATSVTKAINREVLLPEDIIALKEFVLYQRQRTNEAQNHSVEERESIMLECARMLCQHRGFEFDEEVIEDCKRRAKEAVTPAENVEMATKMVEFIEDLSVLVIHFDSSNELITSDDPVITLNAFLDFQGFGYDSAGIIFLMPLSPSCLLMVYDGDLYKQYAGDQYLELSSSGDAVQIINQYELIKAERMVFSRQASVFDLITDDICEKREHEEKRNRPQYLGPDDQKIIMSHAAGTRYYYELPFIHIPGSWRKLPFHCKEPIPRHYEDGWKQKLSMKYEILCLAKKHDVKCGMPSKKELKLGCRKMESLAQIYWQSKKKTANP